MDVTWLLLLILLIVLVGIFLAYVSSRPDRFRTARSLTIAASPEKIFPLINELRVMNTWNPFSLGDPNAKGNYSGPASGAGAIHEFDGRKSGTGRIEITRATPARQVSMRLVMTKPFACDNAIEFTLEPQEPARQTKVTWAMEGAQPFMGKLMGCFIDCDKMVGGQFDKGLAALKLQAER
jgi:hypothetical protein